MIPRRPSSENPDFEDQHAYFGAVPQGAISFRGCVREIGEAAIDNMNKGPRASTALHMALHLQCCEQNHFYPIPHEAASPHTLNSDSGAGTRHAWNAINTYEV